MLGWGSTPSNHCRVSLAEVINMSCTQSETGYKTQL